jgi:glucosamine--fructose-6-phosphate aminotransferase (isomerizing)
MAEQPSVLERLLRESAGAIAGAAGEIASRRPRFGVIAARGSSDNAARYAQHLFGRFWGLPVALATPSLHTLYGAPLDYRDALVVGISQSGASPDVAGVVEAAAAQGAVTVAITNEPDSALGRAARHVIDLRTGPERSVAATKTYTASLGAVAALAGVAERRDRPWRGCASCWTRQARGGPS